MGTRYHTEMHCPYCNYHNDDVYYAPSCGFLSHTCDRCKKECRIIEDFSAKKCTEEELNDYYEQNGFSREE